MMHWINKQVRYVGLELGSNSIVPYSPREILAHGYGDCKDKATVLTTFLRQAGYQAFVALVWNDADEDIRPDVPGMDIFNHALVYVDGPRPLWLDPTSDFSRDEVLPYWDQERWALPAKPGITGPIQTTLYPAETNTAVEVDDYYLQDDGNCNVTETTSYGGAGICTGDTRRLSAKPRTPRKIWNPTRNAIIPGKRSLPTIIPIPMTSIRLLR